MARSRIMLYNLINKGGKVSLNIGLSGYLIDCCNHHADTLKINLQNGQISISKLAYLNTGKVYDTGKVCFLVATKSFSPKQIKRVLLQYACDKIDSRLEHLLSLKLSYQKLFVA